MGEDAFQQLNQPVLVHGQRGSGLRFAALSAQALLSALLVLRLLARGFTQRDLRKHWAPLLGRNPEELTPGQLTYQLRRLRLHGLNERLPNTHRYRVTERGGRTALFCTRCDHRLLRQGLAQLGATAAGDPPELRRRGRGAGALVQAR